MKRIGEIFITDIRSIVANWAAAVIVLGLVGLPSLYAWFNIAASWDPYGQTGGLRVAVVNDDKGADLRGTRQNFGDEIVASLKENKAIGWIFTDDGQALRGVRHGDYYASIVIPANFSERIATVLTGTPRKAEIVYTVNEKINAVAPKITGKGATGIIEEVSRSFVKTANGAIFSLFNEIGIELEQNLPSILKVRDTIFRLEAMIPEIHQALGIAAKDIAKAQAIADTVQRDLPLVEQLARDGENFAVRLGQFLDRSGEALATVEPGIQQDLVMLQQVANGAAELTAILQAAKPDPAIVAEALDRTASRLAVAAGVTGKLGSVLERLNGFTGNKALTPVINRIRQIEDRFTRQLAIVNQFRDAVNRGAAPAAELVDGLNRLASDTSSAIGSLLDRYDTELMPKLAQAVDRAKQDASKAQTVLSDAVASMPDAKLVVGDAVKGLAAGSKELAAMRRDLPAAENKLRSLADRIRILEREGNLNELIDLLKNNTAAESDFFAEPVLLKENKLFPIPNYGSAMSPFFTTLSLWVGALLLVSLLTVEIHDDAAAYRSYQVYFGRLFTFLAASLLQSGLVTCGDIWLLGTFVVDKWAFIAFGLLLSAVFMLMVYTLVSVFGNVGKAMAIVLLVLQLAGSGGTFPIEVTPWFFQAIHPFLPFTYGISMMREAAGGIVWDIVARDMTMLALFAAGTLAVGLALKKAINRGTAGFVRKAKASRLIH